MPKPTVITVLSGKGGVGKTVISANLASLIAKDYDVLLVDTDYYIRSLTGLLTGFDIHVKSKKKIDWWKVFLVPSNSYNDEFREKVKDVLNNVDDYIVDVNDYIVRPKEHGLVSLLPSYYNKLRPFDWTLEPVPYRELFGRVESFFRDFKEKTFARYRFVIIDTHAGLTNLNVPLCLNSDYSIIVTEEDFLSLDASFYLIRLLQQHYKEEYPGSELTYFFVVNKINELWEISHLTGLITALKSNNISFVCRYMKKIKEIYESKSAIFIPEEDDDYKEFRYALLHLWKNIANYEEIKLDSFQEIENDNLDY